MRFLVDVCVGPRVARWLDEQGHDVQAVFDLDPTMQDLQILEIARRENRIVVTIDNDFADHVFADRRSHGGIVLMRLRNERSHSKIGAMERVLIACGDRIAGRFVLVTDAHIRISRFDPTQP